VTFVPTTAATTVATAAAAAKVREEMRKEEENLTGYNKEDLEGWEFKIVRAATRKFRDPKIVRQVCDEEARAGWEMLEKFDDYRIRFKRSVEHRANDAYLNTDPYRTQLGITGNRLELTVAAAVILALGVLGLVAFLIFGLGR
jgi:hypothetical protein